MLPRGHTTTHLRNANLRDRCLKPHFVGVFTYMGACSWSSGEKSNYITVLHCDSQKVLRRIPLKVGDHSVYPHALLRVPLAKDCPQQRLTLPPFQAKGLSSALKKPWGRKMKRLGRCLRRMMRVRRAVRGTEASAEITLPPGLSIACPRSILYQVSGIVRWWSRELCVLLSKPGGAIIIINENALLGRLLLLGLLS